MDQNDLTADELRERYDAGELDLGTLDKDELDAIFERELDALERDPGRDTSFLEACASELRQRYPSDISTSPLTRNDLEKIERRVLASHGKAKKAPRRRTVVLIAAVVCILAVLAISAIAYYNPFAEFGLSEDEADRHAGEEVTDGSGGSLLIGKNTQVYNSFEELSSALNVQLLHPNETSEYTANFITSFEMNDYKAALVKYVSGSGDSISYTVYLGHGADDSVGKELYLDIPGAELCERDGYEILYVPADDLCQTFIYDGELTYEFSLAKRETVETFINSLSY